MGVKGQYLQHKSIKDRTVFGVSLAHTWFRGKRAVIDIQNLLHRGKAQNPRLLAQLEHEPNLVDLNDVKRLQSEIALFTVNILLKLERECGINFIAVFDGRPLPSKAAENQKRRQDRKKAYCKAVSCEAAGDTAKKIHSSYMSACSIQQVIKKKTMDLCLGEYAARGI